MKKILILIVCIFFITGCSKKDNGVGIYHTSNWNGQEASLILNKDKTCKYPNNNSMCTWNISNDTIKLKLTTYYLKGNTRNIMFDSMEKCMEYLKANNGEKCEESTSKHEAKIINNGVLLHEHLFNKVK